GRVGIGRGHAREVGAGAQLAHHFLGARGARGGADGERPPCGQPDDRLQQSLAVATAAYLAELNRVTLADLIPGSGEAHGDVPGWLATNAWRWRHSALEEGA
ncbi:hypothetical protein HMPREF9710_02654, partial [Massilia timonae CCUG 45783]